MNKNPSINAIHINHKSRTYRQSLKMFDMASCVFDFGTDEYNALQMVRKDYPNYNVVVRKTRNKKESLSYPPMTPWKSTSVPMMTISRQT